MSVLKEKIDPQLEEGAYDKVKDKLLRLRNQPKSRKTKLIRAGEDAGATIAVAPNVIDISAPKDAEGEPIGISVIGGQGTIIRGRVGFTATPGEIRVAGLWVMNDLLLSATPSTIMTPIPVMRFSPPLESISRIATSAAVLASLATIAAVGAA
jgi:hypothetical protein